MCIFIGGVVSVCLHFILVRLYDVFGAIYSVLTGEIFIFVIINILFAYIFLNKRIKE